MTAKNLPVSEQPYEKCLKSGAASLSDAELLAVIIRCGTNGSSSTEVAKHVLSKRTGNLLGLYQMSLKELQEVPGIGKVKAIQLKCIAELSKRIAQTGRQQAVVMQNAFSVQKHHLDTNHHVNNCQYVQMALEVLPRDILVSQVRVDYKKSAVLGDKIFPETAQKKDRVIVRLCDEDRKPYAVIEFKTGCRS